MLFITLFLTTYNPSKTLYSVIGNNFIRFEESKISQLFSLFFKSQSHNFFSNERIFCGCGCVILCILCYRCCDFNFSTFFCPRKDFFLANSNRLHIQNILCTYIYIYILFIHQYISNRPLSSIANKCTQVYNMR